MRQIICEDRQCYLEPASQYGGGMSEDGLSPAEPSYMIPLSQTARGQSSRKLQRKRRSTFIQVGGGGRRKTIASKKKISQNWRTKQSGQKKKTSRK